MTNIEWHFRKRDPGEAIIGGVNQFAFQMSIDTLVRETIQNSNDQRLDTKVEVHFVYEELLGPQADRLLEMIGWENGLRTHLESIANGSSHLKERAARAIKSAKDRKIRTLTIKDFGARGLEGDEDGLSGNFAMLCRHVLVTEHEQKALRGGAFGIGKSVLWAFSDASTVLFSSLPMEKKAGTTRKIGSPRFFGRAYLVSHQLGSKGWHNGDGHFGEIEETVGIKWAKSVRNDGASNMVVGTVLERDLKSTGTSILIPFLDNPRVEDEPTPQEMVRQIVEATQVWFWPSLDSGVLEVHVGFREKNIETLEKVELPQWTDYMRRALIDGKTDDRIEVEGGSARKAISINVPQRTADPLLDKALVDTTLHLTRLAENEAELVPEKILGSVALVRGAQMVVEYHKASIPSLLPPFVGVLRAGTFNGKLETDMIAEYFLRDAEPPAHDKWDKASEKLGVNYKRGGHAAVGAFLLAIGTTAKALLGTSTVASGRVPKNLADLLRGAKGGSKKPPRTERFQLIGKHLERDAGGFATGSFTARRNLGKGPWSVNVSVVLVDEQGSSREVAHKKINEQLFFDQGITVVPDINNSDKSIRGYKFLIPANLNEITGSVVGDCGVTVGMRSLADLQVRYSSNDWGKQ